MSAVPSLDFALGRLISFSIKTFGRRGKKAWDFVQQVVYTITEQNPDLQTRSCGAEAYHLKNEGSRLEAATNISEYHHGSNPSLCM